MKLVDNVAEGVGGGITPTQLLRKNESRSDWSSMVANVLGDMSPGQGKVKCCIDSTS